MSTNVCPGQFWVFCQVFLCYSKIVGFAEDAMLLHFKRAVSRLLKAWLALA